MYCRLISVCRTVVSMQSVFLHLLRRRASSLLSHFEFITHLIVCTVQALNQQRPTTKYSVQCSVCGAYPTLAILAAPVSCPRSRAPFTYPNCLWRLQLLQVCLGTFAASPPSVAGAGCPGGSRAGCAGQKQEQTALGRLGPRRALGSCARPARHRRSLGSGAGRGDATTSAVREGDTAHTSPAHRGTAPRNTCRSTSATGLRLDDNKAEVISATAL